MKILLFLFPFLLYAQSGAERAQYEQIERFGTITGVPTTANPTAGNYDLFNANSVFVKRDSTGAIDRIRGKQYENLVSNFDIEQGLTPYVYTVGTTSLAIPSNIPVNEKPIEGLSSLLFDATAQNDFIETPLITIPPILMGQVCMIKVSIRGGDANLQLQVVNGAGTIVGFKQLAVFADTTPQFITFNCPTQAAITGTPALGQLKIRIIQSTAVNAALATLDSFYLGEFESNTMTVQEQPQQYLWNGGDFTGNFAFPAATKVVNDKTLFTYAGTTLTVLKSSILNFYVHQGNYSGGGSVSDRITLNCIISGVSTNINGIPEAISNAGSNQVFYGIGNSILSTGDTCTINSTRTLAVTNSTVNITATPLPQLAFVTSSTPNELSARITNTAVVSSENDTSFLNGNCTLNSAGDFTCPFGLYLEKVPACSIQIEDNTNTAKEWNVYAISTTSVSYRLFSDTNVLTSYAHNLKCSKQGDYYSQSLMAILPAQLQTTNQLKNIVGSAEILNPAGTATIGTPNLSAGFLNTISRTALGIVRNTFNPLYFQGEYACSALPLTAFQVQYTKGAGFIDIKTFTNGGVAVDSTYSLTCIGL